MAHAPFPFVQFGQAILGILISIVLPILRKSIPKMVGVQSRLPDNAVSAAIKSYLGVGAFSILTAVIVVALGGKDTAGWEWYTAILAGYAWDSTLQKIVQG